MGWFIYKVYEPIRDWFLQIWFCHHNAKVIMDFEERMSLVIYEATNGKMSKSYYSIEAMRVEINDTLQEQYDLGYADALEEHPTNTEETE